MTAALTCGRLPSCPGILPLASDEIGVGQVFVIAGCPGEAVEVVDVVFAGAGSEAVFAGAGGEAVFAGAGCLVVLFRWPWLPRGARPCLEATGKYLMFAIRTASKCPVGESRQRHGMALQRATPASTRREHRAHAGQAGLLPAHPPYQLPASQCFDRNVNLRKLYPLLFCFV
jgi:hypothetical protein